jgi:hypothetical protein
VVVSEERAVCQGLGVCRLLEIDYLAGGGVRNLCFIYWREKSGVNAYEMKH